MGLYTGCAYHLGAGYIQAFGNYTSGETDTYLCDNNVTWIDTAKDICDKVRYGVGFTVYNTNYTAVRHIASLIKTFRPDLQILCGGPSATASATRILNDCNAIDVCVISEGEETFREIYDKGFKRSELKNIHGLVLRDDKDYYYTGLRKIYKKSRHNELEGIPSPYIKGTIPVSEIPLIGVATSRGCNYQCTYCNFAFLGRHTVRYFPEDQVMEELLFICNYYKRTGETVRISFRDNNFTSDMKRCKRILKSLSEFRPENVTFWIDTRADTIKDKDFYEIAFDGGIRMINFGLEAIDPEILINIKKTDPFKASSHGEKVKEAVELASSHNINSSVSAILGLPGDTPEKGQKLLDFIKTLPVKGYYHNILNIFDGTELSTEHEKFDIKRVQNDIDIFLLTRHSYDARAIPMVPGSYNINSYITGTLVRVLLCLTTMVKRYINFDIPSAIIDLIGDIEFKEEISCPSGTVFIILNRNKKVNLARLCNYFYKSYLLEEENGYYKIDNFMYKNMLPEHIIKFPDNETSDFLPGKSCIEFVKPELLFDRLIESSHNHWCLPYSACSLLRAPCPAKEKILSSVCGNLCPFYLINLDERADCSACEVNKDCPKCNYMLMNFRDKYCSFHKSGKAMDILHYIKAHFYVLFFQEIDLNNLPPVSVKKENGHYIIFAGKKQINIT